MVNVYVVPDLLTYVAPLFTEYDVTPTLSVIVAVNVTVDVCAKLVSVTELLLAAKFEIDGACVSVLVTVTVMSAVAVFPAASCTVAVSISLVDPNE